MPRSRGSSTRKSASGEDVKRSRENTIEDAPEVGSAEHRGATREADPVRKNDQKSGEVTARPLVQRAKKSKGSRRKRFEGIPETVEEDYTKFEKVNVKVRPAISHNRTRRSLRFRRTSAERTTSKEYASCEDDSRGSAENDRPPLLKEADLENTQADDADSGAMQVEGQLNSKEPTQCCSVEHGEDAKTALLNEWEPTLTAKDNGVRQELKAVKLNAT